MVSVTEASKIFSLIQMLLLEGSPEEDDQGERDDKDLDAILLDLRLRSP